MFKIYILFFAAIFMALLGGLFEGLNLLEHPDEFFKATGGLSLVIFCSTGLSAETGFLIGLWFRHHISSPNLHKVLVFFSVVTTTIILILGMIQAMKFGFELGRQKYFPPADLHWGWHILVATSYTLCGIWGILRGLTNTTPGFSRYELQR